MEGNNFSHTNTFLFESILFFSPPPKSEVLLEGKQESCVPRKAASFQEGLSTSEDCLTPNSRKPRSSTDHLKLKHKLCFSHCNISIYTITQFLVGPTETQLMSRFPCFAVCFLFEIVFAQPA